MNPTVFERHNNDVIGTRPRTLQVVRLYVNRVYGKLIQFHQVAYLLLDRFANVPVGGASVVSFVADVIAQ